MINFFKKIRQLSLSEGKTVRYLKYAIGEIVLVVIGILIALKINTWNQQQIENRMEKESLINLAEDLEEQSELLDRYIIDEREFFNDGVYVIKHYAKHKTFLAHDTVLSKLNTMALRRTFTPINTAFEEMVSTGNIGLIRNKKLKRNILKFYNEMERVSMVTLNNNTNLIDGLYNPVLMEQTLYVFNSPFPEGTIKFIFNEFQKNQERYLDAAALESLHSTSQKMLMTPEKALNLFNVLQIRMLLASGQQNNYERLKSDIIQLREEINQEIGE